MKSQFWVLRVTTILMQAKMLDKSKYLLLILFLDTVKSSVNILNQTIFSIHSWSLYTHSNSSIYSRVPKTKYWNLLQQSFCWISIDLNVFSPPPKKPKMIKYFHKDVCKVPLSFSTFPVKFISCFVCLLIIVVCFFIWNVYKYHKTNYRKKIKK